MSHEVVMRWQRQKFCFRGQGFEAAESGKGVGHWVGGGALHCCLVGSLDFNFSGTKMQRG